MPHKLSEVEYLRIVQELQLSNAKLFHQPKLDAEIDNVLRPLAALPEESP